MSFAQQEILRYSASANGTDAASGGSMIHETEDPQAATFWVPGSRRRFAGDYRIGVDGGVEVAIFGGSPSSRREFHPIPVLLGDVQGTPVTCVQAYPRKFHGEGLQERSQYTVVRAFENRHIRTPDTAVWAGVSAEIENLEAFRRVRILDRAEQWSDASMHDLPVDIGERGRVTFVAQPLECIQGFPEQVTIKAHHSVSVKSPIAMSQDVLWARYMMPLGILVGLAGFGGGHVSNVRLHAPRSGSERRMHPWVQTRVHTVGRVEQVRGHGELIVHGGNWDVSAHLSEWFALFDSSPSAFASFAASLDTNATAPKLLYAASACEALHTALYPQSREPSARQRERLDRVLQDIRRSKDRAWAKHLLARGHSVPLERRLELLATEIDSELATDLLGDVKAWARHAAHARNKISHSDADALPFHQNPALTYQLSYTMNAVFALVTMGRIGFTAARAAEAFRDSWSTRQQIGQYPLMAQASDS
jgi:hypothetical protein